MCVYVYLPIYIYFCTCIYFFIYIHTDREREIENMIAFIQIKTCNFNVLTCAIFITIRFSVSLFKLGYHRFPN